MLSFGHRAAAATGALYVLCIIVGNTLATSGDSSSMHPTGAAVLRDAERHAHSGAATAGFVLEVLGFTLFIVFLGYLAATFAASKVVGQDATTGHMFGATAVVAGVTMLAIKLGSAAPVVALSMDRRHLDPTLARVLNDINGAAFVLSWLPTAVFVGAAAIALQRAGLVGRILGWSGSVLGVVGVPLAIVGLRDPASANPFAFLLAVLWVLAVSVRLTVRPGRVEGRVAGPAAGMESTAGGVPAAV
ncbi:MAG: hypothetical protein ACXV4A_10285 [Actinomycetes bacterium]